MVASMSDHPAVNAAIKLGNEIDASFGSSTAAGTALISGQPPVVGGAFPNAIDSARLADTALLAEDLESVAVSLVREGRLRRMGARFARLAAGTVRIDDPQLPYIVELELETTDTTSTCRRLTVEPRPGGADIGSERLREILVPRLVEIAARSITFRLVNPEAGLKGGVEPLPLYGSVEHRSPTDDEPTMRGLLDLLDPIAAANLFSREHVRPRRGRRISDADLQQFAEIVRVCQMRRQPYIAAVMDTMRLSTDQARKWKPKAIEAGYLEDDRK